MESFQLFLYTTVLSYNIKLDNWLLTHQLATIYNAEEVRLTLKHPCQSTTVSLILGGTWGEHYLLPASR